MADRNKIMQSKVLSTSGLTIGYREGKDSVKILKKELDLTIHRGEMVCLIGPNGCGKSTLIRTLSLLQPAIKGSIFLEDEDIQHKRYRDIARKLSLVLTEPFHVEHFSVEKAVSLGRYPYTGWLGFLSAKDKEMVRDCMQKTAVDHLSTRYLSSLSDGERQRVMIARALAQDTALMLLDEPTAHIDLPNRVEMMKLLKNLSRETEKAILLSTHELDLALQVADTIWLMGADNTLITGSPEDLILDGSFEKIFHANSFNFDRNTGAFKLNFSSRSLLHFKGEGPHAYWTKRALEREGFALEDNEDLPVRIYFGDGNWSLIANHKSYTCYSVAELLCRLRDLENRLS